MKTSSTHTNPVATEKRAKEILISLGATNFENRTTTKWFGDCNQIVGFDDDFDVIGHISVDENEGDDSFSIEEVLS